MPELTFDNRIAAVRRFNRFYTQRIGVLQEGWVKSPFSLTEARVLYELIHRQKPTASELCRDLGLDAGYLSRILRGFETRGLIVKETSDIDGRQSLLSMTERGRRVFAPVETHTCEEVAAMLSGLAATAQTRLLEAMRTIESVLGAEPEPKVPYLLRPPQAGDFGWIVSRHGVLYRREYGWDERLEALVAEIVAVFVRNFDPKRDCCWMAERRGENAGCAFIVKHASRVARLRLLLVEPHARGLGIGTRLVDECIRFARQAGYRKMILSTYTVLHPARRVYERAGFHLLREEAHEHYGHDLVEQWWELTL